MAMTTRSWAVGCVLALGCGSTAPGGDADGTGSGGADTNGPADGGATAEAGGRAGGGRRATGGRSNGNGGSGEDSGDGGSASDSGGSQTGAGGSFGGVPQNGGTMTAKGVAEKLGRDHFLIGMGNDDDGSSLTLGATLDVRYRYLWGLPGQGGWPDWNEGGEFPVYVAQETAEAGVVPMFTLYAMAVSGEGNGNAANDAAYMKAYWEGAQLLFEKLGGLDGPSVVHLEPDWWAFSQQLSADPTQMPAKVGSQTADCADLPEDMTGMGRCLVKLARKYAPNTLVGFHASTWASPYAEDTANYLVAIGAGEADLVFTDMLDRDAGCFEAQAPECTRMDGPWYLDATNQTHPNFNDLTSWAKTVTDTMGVPIMWWQVPFGVPSDTPGGTPEHYRDNKVKYVFEHIEEFAAAGGVGALFGVGAANQTYVTTDGGQFKNACQAYFASPYLL